MIRKTIFSVCLVSAFSIFLLFCGNTSTSMKKEGPFGWVRNVIGDFSSQDTIFLDSSYVDTFLSEYPFFNAFKKDIKKFYGDRKYAYAWFEDGGIIEQAHNLYNRIQQIEDDGVQEGLPYPKKFQYLMDNEVYSRAARHGKGHMETELMLTSQYFSLAKYVWKGVSEEESRMLGWFIPRKRLSSEEYLDTLLTKPEHDFLDEEPVNKQYELLREQLKKYKQLEATNSWGTIFRTRKLSPGDSSSVILLIRSRLKILGDLADDNGSNIYDIELEYAVRNFQLRHGLKEDGIIGKEMLEQLNVPVSKRIEQIIVNMERTRWVPMNYSGDADYILVNIPEFKLHVYENNAKSWDCNVVVGETVNKTVIFSGVLKNVVFSPHWNVPETIVKNEILPAIQRNPAYIYKQNLEITGKRNGLPVIRQKPGTENSLGLVKFMFPNTHNIYLHDSPAKALFEKNVRAYSHGCIRVSDPVRLAVHLLRNNPEWDDQSILDAMYGGEEKWVQIKTTIPVFITYFTAWVDESSILQFRKDIYDNDIKLAQRILEKSNTQTLASKG